MAVSGEKGGDAVFCFSLEDAIPSIVTMTPTPREMIKFVIRNVLVFFFRRIFGRW